MRVDSGASDRASCAACPRSSREILRERCLGRRSRGARFRDVNLTDATISHAWLVNVDIDALIDTVVINGVDVTAT